MDETYNNFLKKGGRCLYFNGKILDKISDHTNEVNKKIDIIYEKLDYLEKENSEQKTRLLYLETLIKDIYLNTGGINKQCPICKAEFSAFLPFGANLRENALCPNCGSLERHRASYLLLNEKTDVLDRNIKLLHFAPELIFYKLFSKKKNIDYLPVDLNPEKRCIKETMDIQDIKYPINSFDVIYCSHVLEHVPDDKKALSEMFRVLKPDGAAIIMVPINPRLTKTLEDQSINTPELRAKHYGQFDHLRYYGLDFVEKLEKAGFKVTKDFTNSINEECLIKYGLNKNDIIFYCTK